MNEYSTEIEAARTLPDWVQRYLEPESHRTPLHFLIHIKADKRKELHTLVAFELGHEAAEEIVNFFFNVNKYHLHKQELSNGK